MITGLVNIDSSAYRWLIRLQQRRLVLLLNRWVSFSGDGYLYVGIGLLVYFTQPLGYVDFLRVGLLAFLIELPCFMLLKAFIKRDRPFVQLPGCQSVIQPSDQFSMPSGHTAAAFLMASLIALFYLEFALIAFVWAMLIGLSRVVLGVHFPSDIAAGAALGSSAVFLAQAILL